MAYKIEIDHEEEAWKVINENSIETEDGFEDELIAIFYNPSSARVFVNHMNQYQ